MKIYKNTLMLFLCFTVLSTAAHAQASTSRWLGMGIVADGLDYEWEQPLTFYDRASLLMYALGNDSTHLYLCIKTTDRDNQVKIMRGGMKVTLLLKNKREVAITYPLPLPNDPLPGVDEKAQQADYVRLKKTFHQTHPLLRLEGFTSFRGPVKIIDNPTSIRPEISWDSIGTMIYEVVIPLEEIFEKNQAFLYSKKASLLKIEVNALPDLNNEHKSGSPRIGISTSVGGGFGGGFGTGVGIGFGGNPNYSGSPEGKRYFMFQKSEVEQKFKLTFQ